MTFNPQEHLTQVKGKDYLEVKWRLVWFREEHPDYTIDTEFPVLDMDQGVAVCQAIIKDDEGRQLAKGTKTEYKANFFDFVEKSETGAIGRALAALGYGTQFAPEMEEGDRIVDSPVKNGSNNKQKKGKQQNQSNSDAGMERNEILNKIEEIRKERELEVRELKTMMVNSIGKAGSKDCSDKQLKTFLEVLQKKRCEECTEKISDKIKSYCENNQDEFDGKVLCISCQKEYKDKSEEIAEQAAENIA